MLCVRRRFRIRRGCGDLQLSTSAWVRCEGKGRKERWTPLTRQTVHVLRVWLREREGTPTSPLLPSRSGRHLTRGAIWRRVLKHAAAAGERCPSLAAKNITPHALRHTAAMRLLHAPTPVDTATIARQGVSTTLPGMCWVDLAMKASRASPSG